MPSLEGTVIDKRIDEVMAMGSKRNQVYKPREGGTNRNLKNFLPEQLEYTKALNEDLFHTFGYVKDEERIPNNNTPFLDYNGKAKPENVAKTNYFRKLNEIAMEKRMRIRHGDLAPCSDKIKIGPGVEDGFRLISELNIMANFRVLDHIKFAH